MHFVTFDLSLMRADHREQVIPIEELVHGVHSEDVGAAADVVVPIDVLADTLVVIDRVRPEDVAEDTLPRGLLEAVYLFDVLGLGLVRKGCLEERGINGF